MSNRHKFTSVVIFFLLVGVLFLAMHYQQRIADQFKFWDYTPTSEMAQLADNSGLSDTGKFYLYVTHPKIESAESFNSDCRRVEPASPILGCYKVDTDSIHIFDVTNPELNGVKEVTAAHEMLHAVFVRLSNSEKKKLEDLLEAEYLKIKTPKLDERMAYYQRAQPGERVNELHSIIGTEYSNISQELEQYYANYFTDRQKIVALNDQYSGRFTEIENEIKKLSAELATRIEEIKKFRYEYDAELARLNQRIADFNRRANDGSFSSQNQFQAERSYMMQQVNYMDSKRAELAEMIDRYNIDVERHNALGGKMQQLNQSLDSLKAVN